MTFKDCFSSHAKLYAQGRPIYPQVLFDYLSQIVTNHETAWDCATGNGQTAVSLAALFDKVIATDASEQQIAAATPMENIEYQVAVAEQTSLATESVDLVTVSQALHWFDLERFFTEVDRVLKPGGILAVWSYGIHSVTSDIDTLVDELYRFTLSGYWTPERIMVEQGYYGIKFPFKSLTTPDFSLTVEWSQAQLEAYLRSWSATEKYIKDKGIDPVTILSPRLKRAWQQEVMTVVWPLTLFASRKSG